MMNDVICFGSLHRGPNSFLTNSQFPTLLHAPMVLETILETIQMEIQRRIPLSPEKTRHCRGAAYQFKRCMDWIGCEGSVED